MSSRYAALIKRRHRARFLIYIERIVTKPAIHLLSSIFGYRLPFYVFLLLISFLLSSSRWGKPLCLWKVTRYLSHVYDRDASFNQLTLVVLKYCCHRNNFSKTGVRRGNKLLAIKVLNKLNICWILFVNLFSVIWFTRRLHDRAGSQNEGNIKPCKILKTNWY